MNLEKIPDDKLTYKDLIFLSDLFQNCYDAYKRTLFGIKFIQNSDVLGVYQESLSLFDDELKLAMRILREPGGDF